MPPDQLAFQEWLLSAAASIFPCESLPDSPIFTLEAPAVRGLVLYGAGCGSLKFYAAWVESTETFVGWLKVQPAVEGVDSDCAVGGISGRTLFIGITSDLSGHMAIDRFVQGLKTVAWDLGVAEG